MRRPVHAVIVQGAQGGILGGLVVALWFLVVDLLAGRPFGTPALLASLLLQREFAEPTLRLVAAYTVLHFGVFAALGVGLAWVSASLAAPPRLLLGVAFGLLVQEVVFYTGLLVARAPNLEVLPWPHVLGANVASGIAIMSYLHRVEHDPRPFGLPALRQHPLLLQGLTTGLVGAAVVALWFLVLDLMAGAPLRTPAALGAALLFGAGPNDLPVTLSLVATFTVVHVAAFAVAGVAFVALAEQIERAPAMLLLAVLACIVLDALVLGTLGALAQWVLGDVGWWSILGANLLAVGAMGGWVWRSHPRLQRRLREPVVARV